MTDYGSLFEIIFGGYALVFLSLGVTIGLLFGAIPGLTGSVAVALALPFMIVLTPADGFALLIGIYKGTLFGGSLSAIGFGMPGTPEASATVFDGYKLTRKGKPIRAVKTALYSSVAADTMSDLVVIFTFMPLAALAIRFGPTEFFALLLVSLSSVVVFAGKSTPKAIVAAGIGLVAGSMGSDPIDAQSRMTFGSLALFDGLPLLPFLIGLFSFSEIMTQFGNIRASAESNKTIESGATQTNRPIDDNITFREWLGCWREVGIGTITGTILGALPGPGSTLSAYMSYALAGRLRRNRDRFGTGVIEGVAAAESGNSATAGATFIPLFAFGIPGSAMAALFATAFMIQGLTPGPGMLNQNPTLMYAILGLLIVANLVNLIVSGFLARGFMRIATLRSAYLLPVLLVVATMGVYAYHASSLDVLIMVCAGVLGYGMRRFDYPLAPCLLAFIVAPLVETHMRRGLLLADDWSYWVSSPISVGLYAVFIGAIILLVRSRASA